MMPNDVTLETLSKGLGSKKQFHACNQTLKERPGLHDFLLETTQHHKKHWNFQQRLDETWDMYRVQSIKWDLVQVSLPTDPSPTNGKFWIWMHLPCSQSINYHRWWIRLRGDWSWFLLTGQPSPSLNWQSSWILFNVGLRYFAFRRRFCALKTHIKWNLISIILVYFFFMLRWKTK